MKNLTNNNCKVDTLDRHPSTDRKHLVGCKVLEIFSLMTVCK